jgi:hypothetical protein
MPANKGGRPTKRTPEAAATLLAALAAGAGRYVSCQAAGLSPDTFDRWRADDEAFRQQVRAAERTPDRRKKVLAAIAAGSPRRTACRYTGIDESALLEWLAEDIGFMAEVSGAEGQAEVARIAQIADAGRGGAVVKRSTTTTRRRNGDVVTTVDEQFTRPEWTTAAWWLERVHGDVWAKRDKVDLEVYVRQRAAEMGLDPEEAVKEIRPRLRAVS